MLQFDSLAKCHPYNALWAQLGDLKGALGHPLRVARTILTGKQCSTLNRLVRTLSYFVRCGSVSRHFEEKTEVGLPACTSTKTLTPKASSGALGLRRNQSCLSEHVPLADLDEISEKVSKLCRVPAEAIMCHLHNLPNPDQRRVESVRQNSAPPEPLKLEAQSVVFVVGEDDNMDADKFSTEASSSDKNVSVCLPYKTFFYSQNVTDINKIFLNFVFRKYFLKLYIF